MSEFASASGSTAPALVIASKTRIQLRAAVINAAKSSPVAGFIGAPELLAVLTDITAFSGERITTFFILIVFYLILIQIVITLSGHLIQRMNKYDSNPS